MGNCHESLSSCQYLPGNCPKSDGNCRRGACQLQDPVSPGIKRPWCPGGDGTSIAPAGELVPGEEEVEVWFGEADLNNNLP